MTPPQNNRPPLDARLGAGVLGAGALAFGVLGAVAPSRLARMMGSDIEAARAIGSRDLGNALAFALGPTSVAAAQRLLYDLSDAALYGRQRPAVAAGALSFAALAAWTAWRAR